MFIYLITNNITQKQYVGLTSNTVEFRWKKHIIAARCGSKTAIHAAIRKYGSDSFTVATLASASSFEELVLLEQHYIATFDTFVNGYNLTRGGEGSYGRVLSVEAKQRLRDQRLGKKSKLTDVGRLNISVESKKRNSGTGNPMYGKHHSDDTKRKIGNQARERMAHPEYIHPMLGGTHTAEAKEKIRLANTGKCGEASSRAKQWTLRSPTGEIIQTVSLRNFCTLNQLQLSAIQRTTKTGNPVRSGPSAGWMVISGTTDSTRPV